MQTDVQEQPHPSDRQLRAKAETRQAIALGAHLSVPFIVMNALATVVASYGLLANSSAVVIGAMIIAMLLGPIMGLALGLVDGDTRLLRHALIAEAAGALLVLCIAFGIGKIHLDLQITPEILARTKPNLLDLMIALAGGAAGAYATVSPRISVGLVGVAIATALVPPLASSGICLAHGLVPQAAGAFVLFATNLVAIQCASSLVLYLAGFHEITRHPVKEKNFVWRLVMDLALLLGLGIFLYVQLRSTIDQERFERNIVARLRVGLRPIPGAYLSETRFVRDNRVQIVIAVVRVPNSITPAQTAELEAMLGSRDGVPVELHVRSLLTKEATSQGYLHLIEPEADPVDSTVTTQPPPPPRPSPSKEETSSGDETPPNNPYPGSDR